jgi:aldehyde:ferredoxin oxidoreductase
MKQPSWKPEFYAASFHRWGCSPETFGKLISSATGVKEFADVDYLWLVGERIFNLERMFNVREGFGAKDDVFPRRFTDEPMPEGPSAGQVFEAGPLLKDYYQARGWDLETGVPTKATLNRLGLGFTIVK